MSSKKRLTIGFYGLIVALWAVGFLSAQVTTQTPVPKPVYHPDLAIIQMPCRTIGAALYGTSSNDGKQVAEAIVAEFTNAGLSQFIASTSELELLNYCRAHQDTNLHDAVIAVQHILMPSPDPSMSGGNEVRQ